ncbi:unnamed protein product [Durusdinium trenchii]|uniref:Uncharacterized protein n=1 Tax=Durusdinium trenchii TaxID=1381693 RepID=A0ABP0S4X0_9DINO
MPRSAKRFAAVRERLEEQLKHVESSAKALEERQREYEELRGLLVELPRKVQHPIMVPFGPLASFPGHLVQTNEVLTQLSSEYFALRTAPNAVGLVDRRLRRLQKDKQDVDREFRELTLQRQLAAGEAVRSTSRREEPRAVPGVPGATVQTDEDGFFDIREPDPEASEAIRAPLVGMEEEDYAYLRPEDFYQAQKAARHAGGSGSFVQRLRELEREEREEGEDEMDEREVRDEMKELDEIMNHYNPRGELSEPNLPSPAAAELSPSEHPVASSPADLYRLMGDTGSSTGSSTGSGSAFAPEIRERSAAELEGFRAAPRGDTAPAPARVSKFKAERARQVS